VPSTLTVTSAADTGPGTLRAEIAAAHSGDTIVFAPSLNNPTITLTSGQLLITQSLTIDGPGVTISGNSASRVFEVDAKQSGTGSKVTLSGLTITSGVAHDGMGGGAIENRSELTVNNCTLTGNSAPGLRGGAIVNLGRSMTVSGCTLSGNSAARGGAIHTPNAGATVIDCTISGNTAAQGGGISNGVGGLTVDHCIISGNVATTWGGGIDTGPYGPVTVKDHSTITGNTAPLHYGADVYNQSVLYLDSTSTIGTLDGNPAVPI
jgi:hypothetical protein